MKRERTGGGRRRWASSDLNPFVGNCHGQPIIKPSSSFYHWTAKRWHPRHFLGEQCKNYLTGRKICKRKKFSEEGKAGKITAWMNTQLKILWNFKIALLLKLYWTSISIGRVSNSEIPITSIMKKWGGWNKKNLIHSLNFTNSVHKKLNMVRPREEIWKFNKIYYLAAHLHFSLLIIHWYNGSRIWSQATMRRALLP